MGAELCYYSFNYNESKSEFDSKLAEIVHETHTSRMPDKEKFILEKENYELIKELEDLCNTKDIKFFGETLAHIISDYFASSFDGYSGIGSPNFDKQTQYILNNSKDKERAKEILLYFGKKILFHNNRTLENVKNLDYVFEINSDYCMHTGEIFEVLKKEYMKQWRPKKIGNQLTLL